MEMAHLKTKIEALDPNIPNKYPENVTTSQDEKPVTNDITGDKAGISKMTIPTISKQIYPNTPSSNNELSLQQNPTKQKEVKSKSIELADVIKAPDSTMTSKGVATRPSRNDHNIEKSHERGTISQQNTTHISAQRTSNTTTSESQTIPNCEENRNANGNEQTHIANANDIINLHTEEPEQNNVIPRQSNVDEDKWQTQGRKRNYKRNTGQPGEVGEKFKRDKQRIWMYLSKIPQEINEGDIREFLQKKTQDNEEDFIIKDLKENRRLKTFVVAGDFRFKELFYNPKFWPRGVIYRRFDFKRHYEKYNTRNVLTDEEETRPNSFLDDSNTVQGRK